MVAGTKRGIKFLSITLQSGLQYSIACTSFGYKKQTNKQRKSTHWVSRVHSCSGFRPTPLVGPYTPQIQVHTELALLSHLTGNQSLPAVPTLWPFLPTRVWPSAAKWVGFWCLCPRAWLPQQSLCFYFPSQWNDTLWAPLCWKIKRGSTSRTGTIATRTFRNISQSLECPYFCNSKKKNKPANTL